MKWSEHVEPERTETLATLQGRCGLAISLELLEKAQVHEVCARFDPAARAAVNSYLASHSVESGGLLLGSRYAAPTPGSIVSIERFVAGTHFNGTGVSLTMGTQVWDEARPWLDEGLVVVGWVHSHPNLGAFFSGTDRQTQKSFFVKPWQLGLCIDPVRKQEAWFFGADSCSEGLTVLG